jgi:hypothetical protein
MQQHVLQWQAVARLLTLVLVSAAADGNKHIGLKFDKIK